VVVVFSPLRLSVPLPPVTGAMTITMGSIMEIMASGEIKDY